MNNNEIKKMMTYSKKGIMYEPLYVSSINDSYLIAIYQGALSKFDILIKYRQRNKLTQKWSNIRTPKHIHWAVDILIKMYSDKEKTREFLEFLLTIWDSTKPIRNAQEREKILNLEFLIDEVRDEIKQYEALSEKGEYSIKFLVLLARLLMLQEKTNLETAYMFKNLLEALKSGEDIFKIVSIATHRRKN